MVHDSRAARRWSSLLTLSFVSLSVGQQQAATTVPPQLYGMHFRATAVEQRGFLHFERNDRNGEISFSGYLIDILESVSREDRANFTYELRTPSGYGSQCHPRLSLNNGSSGSSSAAYGATYFSQYNCATDDVNELPPFSNHSTDMYLGLFYVSAPRQLLNRFTVPYLPPYVGTPAMAGTATGIENFEDLIEKQKAGLQPPACARRGAATGLHVKESFPDLEVRYVSSSDRDIYQAFRDGTCEVFIAAHPAARRFVRDRFEQGECVANGKPFGLIGEPMSYGLSHYSIGIRRSIPSEVVDTISYWMNVLMSCNPLDRNGTCPEGNFASSFAKHGTGTGRECGYVMYPSTSANNLSGGAIAGIVLGSVALAMILFTVWHHYNIRLQERRYKKRFVQQIARNIEIGPSPGLIPPDKLAAEVQHIGNTKGVINRADLEKWMSDIHMTFISEKDFDALWHAMDINGTGEVDTVEFIVFLSACGPEFEEVYNEHKKLSKMERLKLAARRLENFAERGEEGVLKLERKLDRNSRGAISPGKFDLPSSEEIGSTKSMPAKKKPAKNGMRFQRPTSFT